MKRPLLALATLFACGALAHGQASSTASRVADIQVGGGVSITNSDYVKNTITGYGFYGDVDFHTHYGVEAEFHQVSDPNSSVYERTYEVGGRYHFGPYGRFKPYGKILYGRGVFNSPVYTYSIPVAGCSTNCVYTVVATNFNLAYNLMAAGAGVDVSILPRLNVRADYEYQDWFSGPGLTNGLTPSMFTIGVAYHIPAGRPRYR